MRHDLKRLNSMFNAENIAIIGASPDSLFGRSMLGGIKSLGFRGRVSIVNPTRRIVLGFPSYPSVEELPETPDCALVLVPGKAVPDTLRALAAKGCHAVFLLAAGYEEPEALAGLQALLDELDMVALGPNCFGYINVGSGLYAWAGPSNRPLKPGPLALIGQSGGVLGSMANSASDRGIGISYMAATGNQANLAVYDLLGFLAEDPDTRVVIVYMEQFGDYTGFVEGVRLCREKNVPVIVLAVGGSESARRVTMGHTGSMTTGPALASAAIRAAGAIQAKDVEEALDKASLFALLPRRAWRDVKTAGVISLSGGWAALMADSLEEVGVGTPPLPDSVESAFPENSTGIGITFNNPLDLTGAIMAFPDYYPRIIDAAVNAEEFDALLIMFGAWDGQERWFAPIQSWAYRTNKPVLLGSVEATPPNPGMQAMFERDPVPYIGGSIRMATALAAMHDYFTNTPSLEETWGQDAPRAWTGPESAVFPDLTPLMAEYGVGLAEHAVLAANDQPRASAGVAYPVVVKLESGEVPHKTELGAVKLPIRDDDELKAAIDELTAIAQRESVKQWKVIAQPLVKYDHALEMLAGVVVDPTVGPVITLSLGGTNAELFTARGHAICPVDEGGAQALIDALGVDKILAGYRGAPALNQDGLIQLIIALSRFAYDHREQLVELDLNPIIVPPGDSTVIAVDAFARFVG
ncbi:MAG: acetate--CoA ligase family protein [Gammaproteobacteria bacterium]|nr:acetate--CoA ligase family protein [Gammaproteobacteria bacterium]